MGTIGHFVATFFVLFLAALTALLAYAKLTHAPGLVPAS